MLPANELAKIKNRKRKHADAMQILYKICIDNYADYGNEISCHDDVLVVHDNIVRSTRTYFICDGIKYKKNKEGKRKLLDFLFTPTRTPEFMIELIHSILPQPIAEEIIPEMSALPMCYYFSKIARAARDRSQWELCPPGQ